MRNKRKFNSEKRKMTRREGVFMGLFFFALIPFGICLMISNNMKDVDLNYDKTVKGIVTSKAEIRRQNKKREYYVTDYVSYSIPGDSTSYSLHSGSPTDYKVGDSVDLVYSSSAPEKAILKNEQLDIDNDDVKLTAILVYPFGALAALFLFLGLREGFKKKREETTTN